MITIVTFFVIQDFLAVPGSKQSRKHDAIVAAAQAKRKGNSGKNTGLEELLDLKKRPKKNKLRINRGKKV